MPLTDPIADFLTRIRNAQKAKLSKVEMPASSVKERIAKIMHQEGYIRSFNLSANKTAGQTLHVELKYNQRGLPLIREITRISKPGWRRYASADQLASMRDVVSTTIVSTSRGVMTDREACEAKIGGEMICRIS